MITMNKPYIIYVGDERSVLTALKEQIKLEFRSEYNIKTLENGADALDCYNNILKQNNEVLLVICDYLLPDIKGDDFFCNIRKLYPEEDTKMILFSGYATLNDIKNAINKTEIFKYISKPFYKENLYFAIRESINIYDIKKKQKDEINALRECIKEIESVQNILCIRVNKEHYFIRVKEIIYLEINGKILKIVMYNNKKYEIRETLDKWEQKLSKINNYRFVRCHRNFIINLEYAYKCTPVTNLIDYEDYYRDIILKSLYLEEPIPVSRRYYKNIVKLA
jgi:DNA-binding LytR/AlgR family response regulator